MSVQNQEVPHGTLIAPAEFTPSGQTKEAIQLSIKKLHVAVAIAAIIAITITWFLISARSISFITEPPNAVVKLDGGFIVPVGKQFLLKPGNYNLEVSAEGYHSLSKVFEVNSEQQNQQLSLTLKKLPGNLKVQTNPSATAQIFIDDKLVGDTTNPIKGLEAGEHLLSIESERFLPLDTTVDIEGLNKTQTITVDLVPAWATINISTSPSGAKVFVDGEELGTTPIDAEIVRGERELMVKLSGYEAWSTSLEVVPGEDQTVPEIILSPADALVMIQSQPAKASVTINDKYYGQTPIEVELPPGQGYQLTLFRDGYQAANQKFAVKTGEDTSLNLKLEPNLGTMQISAQPADALLYIDGRLMGRANQEITLPAKQHTLLIQKEGFVDYKTSILPRPGLKQTLDPKLKTLEQAKWENTPLISKTSIGQALKLFRPKGVPFQTGASRREAGRRANEVQRDMSISRAFYLSTNLVSNKQFRQFSSQHSSSHFKGNSLDSENYPVVNVNWRNAALFCNWLSEREKFTPFYTLKDNEIDGFNPQANGYRLPTEAEWVWISRVTEENTMLKYPWGSKLPPAKDSGNFADRSAANILGQVFWEYVDNFPTTSPVGHYPANHKGIHDTGGNAAEWLNDFYEIKTGLSMKVEKDPLGPSKGDYHVIRGSSWMHSSKIEMRLSFRDYGIKARKDVGFRVARWVE